MANEGDEVRIDASLNDDISAAVARIEQRLAALERDVDKLGRTGAKSGAEFAAGMDTAADAADNVGDEARQAKKPVKDLGDEALKSGTKAKAGASGLDSFAKKAKKASKEGGGLRTVLVGLKFAGIVTGVFALAGGLSALGAGGIIAAGGLAPMVGVVAGMPVLFAAAKLSLLSYKLAAASLEPVLTSMKNQFTELGPAIAKGGLERGLIFLNNHLGGLAKVSKSGLASLGGQLGDAAEETGRLVSSAPFLAQVQRIFYGLEPIVGNLTKGLINLARALINVIEGAMPMAQDMAATFASITRKLMVWTQAQLANGRMAAWLSKSWEMVKRAGRVLWDILVGLFNIFRIGAGYAGSMGDSLESAAAKFRAWTGSAEGQARINQYFQDSLPALREMGKLLGAMAAGLAHLGANQNVAPLLEQIRTQFGPALSELIAKLSGQGGLGPALIEAATGLVRLMASFDFSALTLFILAIARLAESLVWIGQNVPGASFAISALVGAFLGFKLLAPVWGLVGKGAEAFKWVKVAAEGTGELSLAQKALGSVMRGLGSIFGSVGGGIVKVIQSIGAAMLANPILIVIAVIIALIVVLWLKCAWFRDLVMTVWRAIATAGIAAWEALKTAFFAVVNALTTAATSVRDFFVGIWKAVSGAVVAAFTFVRDVVMSVVNTIIDIVMAIWNHGVKQTLAFIVGAFMVAFNIVKFVVQTAIYIIVAIIVALAYVVRFVMQQVAAFFTWAFDNVILPVINYFRDAWDQATAWVSDRFHEAVTFLVDTWNAFWASTVAPVINLFVATWNTATGWISAAWNTAVGFLTTAWNNFWASTVAPAITIFRSIWQSVVEFATIAWNGFVGKITSIWNGFKTVVSAVVGAIRTAWGGLTSWLSSVFTPVGKAIGTVWDGIQTAATKVAGVVKGAWDTVAGLVKGVWNTIAKIWNAIPDIHVPDWVPIIGGKTFGLPKLPTMFTGGPTPGGPALVGEHGPEPLVRGGRIVDTLGANGPEVRDLPRGGYVLPNLSTLARGMAKPIPANVAASVARSAPAYAAAGAAHDSGLRSAISDLATAVRERPPAIAASGDDVERKVLNALRTYDREQRAAGHRKGPYDYEAGRG